MAQRNDDKARRDREASRHLQDVGSGAQPEGVSPGEEKRPSGGGGIASGVQRGGTLPGGGPPGAGLGSIGTGGASTGGAPTGNVKRGGR